MKEYFPSPAPFIGSYIFPTLILGSLGFGLLSAGDTKGIIAGIICLLTLGGAYWWAVAQVTSPAVTIEGHVVTVRSVFGRAKLIDDVKEYQLVISNTWIGFRVAGHQDVIIDKGRFSKKTWLQLTEYLRSLPVAGIV